MLPARSILVLPLLATVAFAVAQEPGDVPTFADVAEILHQRCVKCHSDIGAPLGLELDSLAGLESGSWNGAVAKPGDPEGSEIVRRIKGISQPRMPFDGPPYLDDAEIALIEQWIAVGMPAGEEPAPAAEIRRIPGPGEPVLYADIERIVLQRCTKCHSDKSILGAPPEGLRLTSRDLILAGDERVVVVPGNPGASELVRRIRGQSLPRMPFDGPPFLDEDQMRLIVEWIAQGARDDAGAAAPIPVGARVRLDGTLTGRWSLDDTPLTVASETRIHDEPQIGERVEVRGEVGTDGSLIVTRLRPR